MEQIKVDTSKIELFIDKDSKKTMLAQAVGANVLLHNKKGEGAEFLGWVELPSTITKEEIERINSVAKQLSQRAEVVVVIGIGGSYLGAKAVIEALSDGFEYLNKKSRKTKIVFAGQNLSEEYLYELMQSIKQYEIATIVISKSGTTTESAIAFRVIRAQIEARYGVDGATERIVAITDSKKGALKSLAIKNGYQTFDIPDNIGGRFSVLTPVGLLPMAVAGIDIERLIDGAKQMQAETNQERHSDKNPAIQYAIARNLLYRKGYKIEILASYEPKLSFIAEWWKQLYGESEGKEGKGLFPASINLTADLHSMGQYIQQGERHLFETVISVEQPKYRVVIESDREDMDGLNYIAGRRVGQVNSMAEIGVAIAHIEGGVPNIKISIPKIDELSIGALLYMFEKGCGISGYMLGVNPFDQPGVEEYKRNMFALLDKPGYEQQSKAIKKKL